MDISEDFYEYFCATRWLLDADPSLFCVSAWNDNGRASLIDLTAHQKLYRSDFFPGLGWLTTRFVCGPVSDDYLNCRKLWKEFGPQWPDGFWDDWIRMLFMELIGQCFNYTNPKKQLAHQNFSFEN